MTPIKDKLLSPEWWFFSGLLLALLGLALMALGRRTLGMWLTFPLGIEIAILLFAVIPFLLYSNRKHRKRGKKT